MNKDIKLTQEIVRELLDYDPETGLLFWKERHHKWFKNTSAKYSNIRNAAIWNNKYKGKEASTKHKNGYKVISIFKKRYYSHRLAWLYIFGNFPLHVIDHINGIVDDNRLENLREVTNQENHVNMKRDSRNKSGITGVTWDTEKNKWIGNIFYKGKNIFLGYSEDKQILAEKRKQEEQRLGFHINHGRE